MALNRPEKRNALSLELCGALVEALAAADGDRDIGAILLTANGKSFCAGMDLGELGATDSEPIADVHEQLFTVGARLGKPLIAAVQGAALGGGTGLVANCHIVVAAEDASFGLTEIRLGLWPFLVFRAVAAALGERRTLELSLTGRTFGAGAAREMGLIHEIVANPDDAAMEVASRVAAFNPAAIQTGLAYVRESRGKTWEEAGQMARQARSEVFRSPGFQEGLRAFREKGRAKPGD